jgi:polar amino acid transport system substrate-binding protein
MQIEVALRRAAARRAPASVDLARAWAQVLGLPLKLLVVDKAAESVAAVTEARADIGFFAIDPARAATIAFTAPYVLIEGWYAVPQASAIRDLAQVDQPGVRVAVAHGSAYDLHLSRALRHATLRRAPTAPEGFGLYLAEGLEVAAPSLHNWVMPITLLVLTGLFSVQRFGTGGIGKFFGPITLV